MKHSASQEERGICVCIRDLLLPFIHTHVTQCKLHCKTRFHGLVFYLENEIIFTLTSVHFAVTLLDP